MKKRKFSKNNKDKIVNTIIEIRKEILKMLRDLSKDLDRELYNSEERNKIRQEVKEIAEMIRDKDKYQDKVQQLEPLTKNELWVQDTLIRETREKVKALLKLKRDSIVATQYDQEELEIVNRELEDANRLVTEKDRLVKKSEVQTVAGSEEKRVNSHLSKYFKMDDDPEL